MASGSVNFGGVELKKQPELAWCYAQVCSIVSQHVGGAAGWSACQIVAANLAVKLNSPTGAGCNCCAKNKPSACTGAFAVGKMVDTLTRINLAYNTGDGMPSSDRIASEINANRPIIVSLTRLDKGPGHVALIVGYDDAPRADDKDRTDMLTLFDPAAQNIPIFNGRIRQNMTLDLTIGELYSKYPSKKYEVSRHYYGFAAGANGLAAAPAWAVFQ
jgi:hypothetical protein